MFTNSDSEPLLLRQSCLKKAYSRNTTSAVDTLRNRRAIARRTRLGLNRVRDLADNPGVLEAFGLGSQAGMTNCMEKG